MGQRADRAGRRNTTLVVACAMGLLLATPVAAQAAPVKPPPSPSPESPEGLTPGGQPQPSPGEQRLERIRAQVERLHDEAGSATEAYNKAEEKAKKQRKAYDRLRKKVRTAEGELSRLNLSAGAMARAQYRNGGMPAEAQLMLEDDPVTFLRDAGLLRKGQRATRGVITELGGIKKQLDANAKKASGKWKQLEANRKRKASAKKKINSRLKEARKLESQLAADELKKLLRLEDKTAKARQAKWLESGILDEISDRASKKGAKAIGFATDQIGKDYEWGAEGPLTYDCSGLMLRAWESAGVRIPRTSQEQWRLLERVPIAEMRPGDLIIYKSDASHVGMYVGKGSMVHAPRTGRQITLAGAGSLPILGVVRPD
ncbi:NlpC/P60 family protein [Streptomyces sp. NPDC005438]|uniref:C40 family peptidase n=1 Tax=Streptomyces sp. NPDC005438 TaxID=3156880 RepID=UPI0033A5B6C8